MELSATSSQRSHISRSMSPLLPPRHSFWGSALAIPQAPIRRHNRQLVSLVRARAITPGDAARWDGGRDGSGDAHLQQMLVDLVRVQCGQLRMESLVEERQNRIRRIGEDSTEELNRIAYRAMQGVDELTNRVLKQLDAGAYEIERDLEMARRDMEARQREFEEFERRMHVGRNEGLFFKGLYSAAPTSRSRMAGRQGARMEGKQQAAGLGGSAAVESGQALLEGRMGGRVELLADSIMQVSKSPLLADEAPCSLAPASAPAAAQQPDGPSYKQLLHAALSVVLVSFLWSNTAALLAGHWIRAPKLLAYSCIFSALLIQLKYEPLISGRPHLQEEEGEGEGALPVAPPLRDE